MLTFIDCFAGCGGIRLAFEKYMRCVWGCEVDRYARQTYGANFGAEPEGKDITVCLSRDIPDFDLLCGGFPCQPFSSCGQRKGLLDTRGTLYLELLRILRDKRPRAFLFENVVGILPHLPIIAYDFRQLGYSFQHRVIDSGLVWYQHRKRVYMVGHSDGSYFEFPDIPQRTLPPITTQLEDTDQPRVSDKMYSWLKHRRYVLGQKGAFGFRTVQELGYCPTLLTTQSDRILVSLPEGNPRWLTVRERARMMGFPDTFQFPVSKTQAIKQIGNSVVVPLVEELARALVIK